MCIIVSHCPLKRYVFARYIPGVRCIGRYVRVMNQSRQISSHPEIMIFLVEATYAFALSIMESSLMNSLRFPLYQGSSKKNHFLRRRDE